MHARAEAIAYEPAWPESVALEGRRIADRRLIYRQDLE